MTIKRKEKKRFIQEIFPVQDFLTVKNSFSIQSLRIQPLLFSSDIRNDKQSFFKGQPENMLQ